MRKKVLLALIIFIFVLITISSPIRANAIWNKSSQGWWYAKGSLYSIRWDKIDGNWYYFDDNGIMETGWINDSGKYYYLKDSGVLDESKTTTVMPDEIQTIYNIVNIYNGFGTLTYINKGYINKLELVDKSLYKFRYKNQLGDEIGEYYYDPSNGNVYKLEQGILTLLNTNTVVSNINTPITTIEAIDKVKDYLLKNGKRVPNRINVEYDDGSKYTVHCYNDDDSYTSISDWYYVDKYTGNVTSMF